MCVGVFVTFHKADKSRPRCQEINFNQMKSKCLEVCFYQLYLTFGSKLHWKSEVAQNRAYKTTER